MQVQRDLLVQDVVNMMERHFDGAELGGVVAEIDKLFTQRFDALVNSLEIGKPPGALVALAVGTAVVVAPPFALRPWRQVKRRGRFVRSGKAFHKMACLRNVPGRCHCFSHPWLLIFRICAYPWRCRSRHAICWSGATKRAAAQVSPAPQRAQRQGLVRLRTRAEDSLLAQRWYGQQGAFDNKIHVVRNAWAVHCGSRVQGSRPAKHEIRIASMFKQAPDEFLRMIVVTNWPTCVKRTTTRRFTSCAATWSRSITSMSLTCACTSHTWSTQVPGCGAMSLFEIVG